MADFWFGIAAICISILAFGSFGVPIKSGGVLQANVDPLVYQSWKSLWVVLTSWIVLLYKPFTFTPFGIVSGLFWVPAGVAAVLSIQNSGLAAGQGVFSALIVLTSFFWGLIVFREPMWSLPLTLLGIALLVAGVVGMTVFSKSPAAVAKHTSVQEGDQKPLLRADGEWINFKCFRMRRWTFGMCCAVFNGIYGGSIMVR